MFTWGLYNSLRKQNATCLPACFCGLDLWCVCVCLVCMHTYFHQNKNIFLLFTTIVKSNKRIIQSSMRKQKNKKKRKKAHVNCEHFLFFLSQQPLCFCCRQQNASRATNASKNKCTHEASSLFHSYSKKYICSTNMPYYEPYHSFMQVHMYIHNTNLFSPSTFSTYVPQQNMKSV